MLRPNLEILWILYRRVWRWGTVITSSKLMWQNFIGPPPNDGSFFKYQDRHARSLLTVCEGLSFFFWVDWSKRGIKCHNLCHNLLVWRVMSSKNVFLHKFIITFLLLTTHYIIKLSTNYFLCVFGIIFFIFYYPLFIFLFDEILLSSLAFIFSSVFGKILLYLCVVMIILIIIISLISCTRQLWEKLKVFFFYFFWSFSTENFVRP